jgi:hypothetical protein
MYNDVVNQIHFLFSVSFSVDDASDTRKLVSKYLGNNETVGCGGCRI